MAATLQAYLARCGVASSSLKRYPSYSQPQLVANQVGMAGACPDVLLTFRRGGIRLARAYVSGETG